MKNNFTIALLLAAAVAAGAQESRVYRAGDDWVQEVNGTLPAAHNLRLVTDMGSVRVEGGAGNEIHYTVRERVHAYSEQEARREFEVVRISASIEGDTARIRGEAMGGNLHDFAADFTVEVPRGTALIYARTGGGALALNGLDGRVDAQTGGGNIQLDGLNGPVDATSGGGNVQAGRLGASLKIETGGGNVQVESAAGAAEVSSGGGNIRMGSAGRMDLETGGGSITVSECSGNLKASTGGGAIVVGHVSGGAELETGGGSIQLAGAGGMVHVESGGGAVELRQLGSGAEAETGAGSITAEFVASGAKFTSSRLETAAGDIRVYLPANLPVTVDADIDVSEGHTIHTEFSSLKVVSEGDQDGSNETYCKGDLNGGGATLHVHTTTGNIDILRTPH